MKVRERGMSPFYSRKSKSHLSYPRPSHDVENNSGEGRTCFLTDTASSSSLEKADTVESILESQDTHPLGFGSRPATYQRGDLIQVSSPSRVFASLAAQTGPYNTPLAYQPPYREHRTRESALSITVPSKHRCYCPGSRRTWLVPHTRRAGAMMRV